MSILEKIDMNQFIVCSRREKRMSEPFCVNKVCEESSSAVAHLHRFFFLIRFAESGENRLNTLKTDLSDRDELKWKTVKTY